MEPFDTLHGPSPSEGQVLAARAVEPDIVQTVDAYIEHAGGTLQYSNISPKNFEEGRTILELDRSRLVDAVIYGTARLAEAINERATRRGVSSNDRCFRNTVALQPLLSAAVRKMLPFDEPRIVALVTCLSEVKSHYAWEISLAGNLRQIESFIEENGMAESVKTALTGLLNSLKRNETYAGTRKAIQRLEEMLKTDEGTLSAQLESGEMWTTALLDRLRTLESAERSAWNGLLSVCGNARSSKPSKKWLKEAAARIDEIGTVSFIETALVVISSVGQPGASQRIVSGGFEFHTHPTQVHNTHSDLLRGLVWSTSLVDDERLIQTVGDCAEICFQKLAGVGPRSPKIGNACLWMLSNSVNMQSVAQLSRLKSRVKHASVRTQLAKALEAAAASAGMSPADIEEIAVPTFGLTEVGALRESLGEFTAHLEIGQDNKAQLVWIRADGKSQKSVPKAVKEEFPDEIKRLGRTAKDIEKMLPPQRGRIEQLFVAERSWSWEDFRARYLDHPLVGSLARRLIWRFHDEGEESVGAWLDGQFVDRDDNSLAELSQTTRIDLWHPLMSLPDDVLAWREWLERHEVRQPFKQAHREIYVLTDAERGTETYSNRFASHILRQHQFAALCQQRGWRYSLQGAWDSHNIPTLVLPAWDLCIEFWVDPAGEEALSDSGIFLYVSTDQVRFYRTSDNGLLRLEQVPPLVFSEIMRDVDLFVGVASVGNDPNWADGRLEGRYVDYWQSYSFGDLSATAQTRRDVLERLVPRLKIAGRCSFSDKFLVVDGDLRTYKIHLGSGNILMAPNDEYLCIVPARSSSRRGADDVFLPFEGDERLSIILSKAFLLAEDTKIKDPTIISQIRR